MRGQHEPYQLINNASFSGSSFLLPSSTDGWRSLAASSSDEFQINTHVSSDQLYPAIASLHSGGFVVTWESNLQDGSGLGIYGQMYTALGQKDGSEFHVSTYTSGDQKYSRVAALPHDGFVVTWHRPKQGANNADARIYAQIFSSSGAKVGDEFRVDTFESYKTDPDIASLANGGFVIVWASEGGQDGSAGAVIGQRYSSDGQRNGGEFQINTYSISAQFGARAATLADGSLVLTWGSNGQDGSGWGGQDGWFTLRCIVRLALRLGQNSK